MSSLRPSRDLLQVVVPMVLLWGVLTAPLAIGERTLFFRDVFSNHLPAKAFGAAQLREGRIPALNPTWGLGEPYRGNPSVQAFYPDNLLYLFLPFFSAFNLHFALHWLLAALGMVALARRLGCSAAAAGVAGVSYAGSGFGLATLSFYNVVVVFAWWPLVVLGSLRGGRRGLALSAMALSLALLGGEPVTAVLGTVPWLLIVGGRESLSVALRRGLASGLLALAIASPQIVETSRILDFSFRGGPGVLASQATSYSLNPVRLLELVWPLPFGVPGRLGVEGSSLPEIPFFLSLHFGVVGLLLALAGAGRERRWAALAFASLLLAWAGGLGGWLLQVGGGLFRFPEKFLFWLALIGPLLAARGIDRLRTQPTPRWLGFSSVVLLVSGLFLWLGGRLLAISWASDFLLQLLIAAALAALLVVVLKRRWFRAAVLLQVACVAQLLPLWRTDEVAPYLEENPWLTVVGAGARIMPTSIANPPWHPLPPRRADSGERFELERLDALDLHPTPGVLRGLSYPLFPDLEGLQSPLRNLVLYRQAGAEPSRWLHWCRVLGVEYIVTPLDLLGVSAGSLNERLEWVDERDRAGVLHRLYRMTDPLPSAFWPRAVETAANPLEAFRSVELGRDPLEVVTAPSRTTQGEGQVSRTSPASSRTADPDRIELSVSSSGGLAVLLRNYHPLIEFDREESVVEGDAGAVRLVPANVTLLGVEVPAGKHRLVLEVDDRPMWWAIGLSLLTAIGLLIAATPADGLRREVAP